MFAYEIPNLRFSLPAGGAVELHRFVSVSGEKAIQADASSEVIGASMNEVTAAENTAGGHIVEIADGIVIVEAGAAVTAGVAVASDANGKAIAFVAAGGTGTATGPKAGVAITAATAAGQLIAVKI